MDFILKINKEVKLLSGISVPTGSIYVAKANGFVTKGETDHVRFTGAHFLNQQAKDDGKSALQLEGVHDSPISKVGMALRANGQEYLHKGDVSANDFIYVAEVVNNKAQLTQESFLSWIEQVKIKIASKLEGVEAADIELVV